MDQKIDNRLKGSKVGGDYVGGNQTNNYYKMFQDSERKFVVTHNANIKPVSYFTGRETELQELRQRIEAGRKSVLVSGMGGIGKTHICRKLFGEYFEKHSKDENVPFQHIGFIEYDENMDSSLKNGLKFKEQESPEQNQKAAWKELEYLASGGKLLLFVDNVDKSINADPGLQKLKSIPGAVILTSRQASICDEFEPYPIGFLDMEQCKEIYEKIRFKGSGRKVRPEEDQDLNYVIKDLVGRHTITVEHLAHLARIKTWSVRKLREKLEENGFCLEFHKDGKLINIQESYEILYDLSELTEAEQNILEAFSVFPYIPLEAEICNGWLLADAGVDEDDDILMGLYEKGWLQFDIEQESYALHPVFAQFIYKKNRPEFEKHARLIKACKRYLELPENGSPLECQHYMSFAENIIKKVNMGDGLEQVEIINALAYLLQYMAEYEKARGLCRKALAIRERVLGEEHPDTAASYNNLAGVYASQGEYGKAEVLYKKALAIRERVLGEEHPDTATSYNNLAYVYERQGRYEIAINYYCKAYSVFVCRLGIDHPHTKVTLKNMRCVYSEWNPDGDFEQWLEDEMK